MPPSRSTLHTRWQELCRSLKLGNPAPAFDVLWSAYTAAERRYHGIAHVAESLDLLRRAWSHCDDPQAVAVAIWFHDVIQRPLHADNEMLSCQLARNQLLGMGAAEDFVRRIENLILATCHDRAPRERDDAIIADIDLAPLGMPPARFRSDTDALLAEMVDESDQREFDRRRQAFFGSLLARPHIYYSDFFRSWFEERARRNITGELRDPLLTPSSLPSPTISKTATSAERPADAQVPWRDRGNCGT